MGIVEAREIIKGAKTISVLTGAGISAESGIPTFRGAGGLWGKYRPEELATPSAFARDPELVWRWYNWRRGIIVKANPNPGHIALARAEVSREVIIITQNIDGLHQKAGSKRVIEFHGSIWRVRCIECGCETENMEVPLKKIECECGGLLRPAVVWFGEPIPDQVLQASFEAIGECDVLLVVGTSAVVQPAASLAMLALDMLKKVIEVNLEATPISNVVDISIRGKAGEVLPQIICG